MYCAECEIPSGTIEISKYCHHQLKKWTDLLERANNFIQGDLPTDRFDETIVKEEIQFIIKNLEEPVQKETQRVCDLIDSINSIHDQVAKLASN